MAINRTNSWKQEKISLIVQIRSTKGGASARLQTPLLNEEKKNQQKRSSKSVSTTTRSSPRDSSVVASTSRLSSIDGATTVTTSDGGMETTGVGEVDYDRARCCLHEQNLHPPLLVEIFAEWQQRTPSYSSVWNAEGGWGRPRSLGHDRAALRLPSTHIWRICL